MNTGQFKWAICVLFLFYTLSGSLFSQQLSSWTLNDLQLKIKDPLFSNETFRISSQYLDEHTGIRHLYLNQFIKSIEIIPSDVAFHFDSRDQLIYTTGSYISNPEARLLFKDFKIKADQIILHLFRIKSIEINAADILFSRSSSKTGDEVSINVKKFPGDQMSIKEVYFLDSNKKLIPAFLINWKRKSEHEWLQLFLNAIDGNLLAEYNQLNSCDFEHMTFTSKSLFQIQKQEEAILPAGNYRVLPMPIESPIHGSRDLVNQPWLKASNASPFTWHGDGNFLYYASRGNNVDAYEDSDGDDQATGGDAARAYGGSQLNFDFSYDPNLTPLQNKNASVTNLFYWCNLMHDVWYQYGFHEQAGNFQINNNGKGGLGNDYVIAEAIDLINSARNNANFGTPIDGYPGVMQLYAWQVPVQDHMLIESPVSISGKYTYVHTPISPIIYAPISKQIILVNDGSTYPSYACNSLINAAEVNGKIAMVDKGICSFTGKMSRIQTAGAVAVIVCNNDNNPPSGFGGWTNGLTIPAIMLSKSDCQKIKIELNKGVYATIMPSSKIEFKVNQKSYVFSRTSFGPLIPNLSSSMVQAMDNYNMLTDACDFITNGNQLTGKIAIIDEGNCELTYKAYQAQNYGAIAVVICKQNTGYPDSIPKGSYGQYLQIPLIELSKADCQEIKLIPSPTGQFVNQTPQLLDGDLDAGIICHEYAHGISNRLTGGPANVSCLNNAEQMGEGWSDYFGLVMTMKSTDLPYQNRGMGVYASGHPTTGVGVRPYPYNVDRAINPANYSQLSDMVKISQPHGIGYIWCSMIWDMTWAFISHYGFEPDIYNANSSKGNTMAYRLVVEGLKLQACSPGFVDGRNAILKADSILYGGIHSCLIWNCFARRGLGFSANQGSSSRRDDGTAASDLPSSCNFMSDAELFSSVFLADYELDLLAQARENSIILNWKLDPFYQNKSFSIVRRQGNSKTEKIIYQSKTASETRFEFEDVNVVKNENYFYQLQINDHVEMIAHSDWIKCKLEMVDNAFAIYPNPVSDILYINAESKYYGPLELKLFSHSLQLIEMSRFIYEKGDEIRLSCNGLQQGVYFIQLKSGSEYKTYKFVKI